MIISTQDSSGLLRVRLEPESADPRRVPLGARIHVRPVAAPSRGTLRLVRDACSFELPDGWRLDDAHPDAVALAIAFLVLPFSAERIRLPRGVSAEYAACFEAHTGRRLDPIDPRLAPRRTPVPANPGLAYSGGVDSTAAALLLPEQAVAVMARRRTRRTLLEWRPSEAGALSAAGALQGLGRTVEIVPTDMDELVKPWGFPMHHAALAPLLLLADRHALGSATIGSFLSALYGIGTGSFGELRDRQLWISRLALYAGVGLVLDMPLAGLTEAGTSRVVGASPLRDRTSSCVAGTVVPCGRCVKCMRRGLLRMALEDDWPDDAALSTLLSSRTVVRELTGVPLHHEPQYAWVARRYPGTSPALRALGRRIRAEEQRVDWVPRWYPPSGEHIDPRHRAAVVERIRHVVEPMSPEDEEALRGYRPSRTGNEARLAAADLRRVLVTGRLARARMAAREIAGSAWRHARRIS